MREAKIVAVFLAAGKSERMGFPKLWLQLGTECLGNWAFRAAVQSLIDHTIVVTREDDRLDWMDCSFHKSPYHRKWSQLTCKDSVQGQSSSLVAGIKKAEELLPDGIIVLLADQPFITKEMINELILYFNKESPLAFVAACHQKRMRPPVVFSRHLAAQVKGISGDHGARHIFRTNKYLNGKIVHYSNPTLFSDIDTQEDYKEVKEQMRGEDSRGLHWKKCNPARSLG
ncbi:nucleotidyltransferase family protein [Fictibacillus sp. NRS-1165]|uniref:nucleotidyltransferase family protein n=1 Tax=Fictibacillus sp. NRS-1165 TaxID=3144463 RepID=UPI003D19678F